MIHKIAFGIVFFTAIGGALWLGRSSERWTAFALLISALASPLLQENLFFRPELGILLIDGGLLAYLVWLALRSDRFWPIYAAAFQIVGTTIHLASVADSNLWAKAYATAQVFWAYPVLFALLIGTWLEARYRQN